MKLEIWEHTYADGHKVYKASVTRTRRFWFADVLYLAQDGVNITDARLSCLNYCHPYDSLETAKRAGEIAIERYVKNNLANKITKVKKVYP